MMVLAGLVLLAACVNVANLMLARATARQRDSAVRLAIGAGRGRLIRQTLTEALVLVGAGAALGVLFAQQGEIALAAFFAEGKNKIVLDLSLNGRMLLFTVGVAVLTGIACGILPALEASRTDPSAGLQGGSRGIAGNRFSLRFGRGLVILQVALSTVLLAGAGLFIRSLRLLESVDPGFTRDGVLTMEVAPERELSGTPQWLAVQAEMLERVRQDTRRTLGQLGHDEPVERTRPGSDAGDPRDSRPNGTMTRMSILPRFRRSISKPSECRCCWGAGSRRATEPRRRRLRFSTIPRRDSISAKRVRSGRKVRFANYPSRDLVYEIIGVVKECQARHPARRAVAFHLSSDPAVGGPRSTAWRWRCGAPAMRAGSRRWCNGNCRVSAPQSLITQCVPRWRSRCSSR